MNKLLSVLILSFCLPVFLFAQNRTIKGKVTDEDGNGVPNANVVQAGGTRKGAQTDKSGNFSLAVKEAGKINLTISSVGYGTKIVSVTGDNVAVMLEKKVNVQDEVVVVGYQTVKRGEIGGSVGSVTNEQIKDVPAVTGAEALTGRATGVQVTSSEGGPGAEFDVKLRGGTSITQDNTPLYIVDGIPVDNALSVISPQDIQSFDILKDAASTAIYGSRGANGVIIITTKSGKSNKKLSVSYNAFVGWKEIANTLDVLDPEDFVTYQYEQLMKSNERSNKDSNSFAKQYGTVIKDPLTGDVISDMFTLGHAWDSVKAYANSKPVDWQNKMFGRKALQQSHNLTLNGGSKNTQFNLSMSYNKEDGILLNTDFDRKLVSLKIDHKVTNKLKIGTTIRYNNQVLNGAGISQDGGGKDGVKFSRLRNIVKYAPLNNAYFNENKNDPRYENPDPDDPVDQAGQGVVNPFYNNIQEKKRNQTNTINLNGYASYEITKWLSFKTQVGIEQRNQFINLYYDTVTSMARTSGFRPVGERDTLQRSTITNSNVLSYTNSKNKTKFKKNNSIQVLLGQETLKQSATQTELQVRNYPRVSDYSTIWKDLLGSYPSVQIAPGYPTRYKYENSLLSFFTKINYAYKSKYLVSLSYRADGSSKFAEGKRWGYFPAASFAWRVSKEKFMDKAKAVSDLKFRASYGESGNNRIKDYGYVPVFEYLNNSGYGILNQVPGNAYTPDPNLLSNTNIKWETTSTTNLGMDISLFKNFLSLSVDAYENVSNDLLIQLPLPATSGYKTQFQNVGATANRGLEFQLTMPAIVHNKNFNWSSNFNISFNKNEVRSLSRLPAIFANAGINSYNDADYIINVGQPLGQIYGYVNDGYYSIDDFSGYDASNKYFTSKPGILINGSGMAPKDADLSNAQPGSIKFKDISGPNGVPDGIISPEYDKTIIGNNNPEFYGGLNQQFTYKKFDFSVFVNFVYGNEVYNANKIEFSSAYSPDANMLEITKDRYRYIDDNGQIIQDLTTLANYNKDAKIWAPFNKAPGFSAMSWAVEDASFLRINNLTLGYTFKPSKVAKSIRVYATANNLAVFTSYTGYDPEVNAQRSVLTPGVDYSAYPKSRSFLFGVNVNF